MDALPLYGWQYTLDFHRIFPSLAERYGVPLVPFLLRGVFGNEELLQRDMIHPNAAGARVIAANIWPYLQRLAAGLVVAGDRS
jgi:acyl-CoA thioesterase-1